MERQKRVVAVHDISGVGRCSLTVALPIISAAGIETSVMPTAVLSTHTGGFENFTYRDLTSDIMDIANHWKSLDLKFDAIYTGYLGSFEQLELMSKFFDMFKTNDSLVIVDPVMADNGKFYSIFTKDFAKGMAKLCSKADIIVPNLTEAAFLLEEEYKEEYDEEYIEKTLLKLSKLGPEKIVLTGVSFNEEKLGAATYDAKTKEINYAFSNKTKGFFHGTGDVFASALTASLLNDFSLNESSQIAADFTARSIEKSAERKTDVKYGVDFETSLPYLIKRLNLI